MVEKKLKENNTGDIMEEYNEFKIVNKKEGRIYIAGSVDFSSYDESTDDCGDWEYEQNDGTMSSQFPHYWKFCGEDVTFEFEQFNASIDWDMIEQWLWDCKGENRTVDFGDYILQINEGAEMDVEIKEVDVDWNEYIVEIIPMFNYKQVDITEYMSAMNEVCDPFSADGFCEIKNGHIYIEMSKDYYSGNTEDVLYCRNKVIEELSELYAKSIAYHFGISSRYDETVEQCFCDAYNDAEGLRRISLLTEDNLDDFLTEEGFFD